MTERKPYQLHILKDHDNAVRLELWQEAYNHSNEKEQGPQKVGTLRGTQFLACQPGLVEALKSEGHPPSVLIRPQEQPLGLTENTGIYLGLMFRLARPLRRVERIQNVLQGLVRMTPDERQYFYARVQYPGKGRYMERALRLWLGEE